MDRSMQGRVAVVTGASRGIGKGIALELGAAGATVYVTGRSVDDGAIPGTVGATAATIDELGGVGVPVVCDHHDDAQVRAVFDRVRDEQGRLDVLVNNVYSAPDLAPWLGKPFWELPIEAWDQVIDIGVRSHYVASALSAPLLFAAASAETPALIANISSSGSVQYAHNAVYGIGKAALDKMTADMAHELRGRDVAVVSLWPGIVRTELVMMGARTGDDGRTVIDLPGEGRFDLAEAESPRLVGRAVVALATDSEVEAQSGAAVLVADLVEHYALTDPDPLP